MIWIFPSRRFLLEFFLERITSEKSKHLLNYEADAAIDDASSDWVQSTMIKWRLKKEISRVTYEDEHL